jgi:hypothetical protein
MVEKGTSWREKKLALMAWIEKLEDVQLIDLLHNIKIADQQDDQFAENSRNVVERARKASREIEAGKSIPFDTIKEKFLD